MDFDKWARIHRVPAPVVDQLKQEELNNIESLKQCDESVLQMLNLDAAHYGILYKAVQSLKQGDEKLSVEGTFVTDKIIFIKDSKTFSLP